MHVSVFSEQPSYIHYIVTGCTSLPLMSVDLVTIVATRTPDLHPSGASKIFHHGADKPDLEHHISM